MMGNNQPLCLLERAMRAVVFCCLLVLLAACSSVSGPGSDSDGQKDLRFVQGDLVARPDSEGSGDGTPAADWNGKDGSDCECNAGPF